MDRSANALVGAATANVARHRFINLSVGGLRMLRDQSGGGHNLPGLAISALWNIQFNPRLLHRVASVRGKPFNGDDLFPCDTRNGSNTRPSWLPIDMNSTSAAQRHATAEFCACHTKRVSQDPKQRHIGIDIHIFDLAIHAELDGHRNLPATGWQLYYYDSPAS